MKSEHKASEELMIYFQNRDDVVMAFIFGSRASGNAHDGSDWDIAVYFKPKNERIEWEAVNHIYPQERAIWANLTQMLATDNVDLLVLNRAPASIAETAVRGTVLVIKDESLYLKFMRVITSAAEEYRTFVDEFYTISQRSRSLSPRDREDLKRTIDFIEEQTRLYSVYRGFTQEEFEQDPRKRNEIERWLENIVNAVIDISKVVLASRKRLIPPTYRETVSRAVRELKLSEEFSDRFDDWVRLRNVLAHEYLDIKWTRLADFVKTSEDSIRSFIDATKKFLESDEVYPP